MKWTQRIVGAIAIVSAILAVLNPLVYDWVNQANERKWWPILERSEAVAFIHTKGIAPELNDLLARGAKPDGWKATYVTEGGVPTEQPPSDAIVAGDPVALVGKGRTAAGGGFAYGIPVKAPDGRTYTMWMAGVNDHAFPARRIIWLGGMFAIIAWVALAVWVYLDARQRRNASAPAWLLLAVLSGPVGFTVWLITRPDRSSGCPGCGAPTTKGAAYCVRCGHALQPACPDCRRPVEIDWAYCATCGTNLAE